MRLRDIGEFGLIHRLMQGETPGRRVKLGAGDDTAILEVTAGKHLLATVDMMVEGVHFLWPGIPPFSLGYKLMAVNLSDIAAMGGVPRFALVALGLRAEMTVAEVEEIYAGMRALAREYGVAIVGGDTVSSPFLSLNLTLLGEIEPGEAVLRRGAQENDLILVTGSLGKSAAGLAVVLREREGVKEKQGKQGEEAYVKQEAAVAEKIKTNGDLQQAFSRVLQAHYQPFPRVREGQVLRQLGCVHALIDISDGLASEINHLCRESGMEAEIWWESLPCDADTVAVASFLGVDPRELALYGGEDYELLMTVSPAGIEEVKRALAALGTPVACLGRVTGKAPGEGKAFLLREGKKEVLLPRGYEHFGG